MMRKTQFYKILFLVSFWTLAIMYIELYEGVALGFRAPAHLVKTGVSYTFQVSLLTGILFTFFVGIIMASFEVLYLNKLLRKKPLGITLLIKTI